VYVALALERHYRGGAGLASSSSEAINGLSSEGLVCQFFPKITFFGKFAMIFAIKIFVDKRKKLPHNLS
jgi:hypothetical protein